MDASLWNQLFLDAMAQDPSATRIYRLWLKCGVSSALVSATLYLYFNAVSQKEMRGSLKWNSDVVALSKNMASLALDLEAFTKTQIGRNIGHQVADLIGKLNPLFPVLGKVNPSELDVSRLHEDLRGLSKLLVALAKPFDVSVPRKECASRALVWLYQHVQILTKGSENKTAGEVVELLACARSVNRKRQKSSRTELIQRDHDEDNFDDDYFGNSDAVRNRVKRFKADHELEFDLIESLLRECGPPDTFSELTYVMFLLPSLLTSLGLRTRITATTKPIS
jgi:hypothetical protein